MTFMNFLSENKTGVLFAAIVLILGIFTYYSINGTDGCIGSQMCYQNKISPILLSSELKLVYEPDNSIKLFANAPSAYMGNFPVLEGIAYPSSDGMVVGYDEAQMMFEAGLISGAGSKIENLFGMDIFVNGILRKTQTAADMLHFVDSTQFSKNTGQTNRAFFKPLPDGVAKLFITLSYDESKNFTLKSKEGSISNYSPKKINGKTYYPLIVGYTEAQMMRSEKLFSKTGDILDGFFGHDIFIAAILEKTDTASDMAHYTPFKSNEVNWAK